MATKLLYVTCLRLTLSEKKYQYPHKTPTCTNTRVKIWKLIKTYQSFAVFKKLVGDKYRWI